MKNKDISLTVVFLLSFFATYRTSSFHCAPNQFLEYKNTGIISCNTDKQFYGIYWYNSTDSANNPPFLYRDDSQGNGNTYAVEGYEILDSGSLLIENVSLADEHLYRTVLIHDESSRQVEIRDINVIVTAKPALSYPVIDSCTKERFCFSKMGKNATFRCSVEDSKPAVSLKWSLRTAWNDTEMSSEILISEGRKWLTSSTTITASWPNRLSLLVCKALYPPGFLLNNDSFILVENQTTKVQFSERKSFHVKLGYQMTLICPLGRKHVLKWEKIAENGRKQTLGFAFLSKDDLIKTIQDHHISKLGDLTVERSNIQHEGLYKCTFSDGLNEGEAEIKVLIYVNPDPAYPIIEGCEIYASRYCVLHVQTEGILTCSLRGIRPVVQLELGVFMSTTNDLITFNDRQVVTENSDGTFDIILTSRYILHDESNSRFTVQCRTAGSNSNLSTVFDLHFMNEVRATSPSVEGTNLDRKLNILWVMLPVGLFLTLTMVWVCMKCVLSKKTKLPLSHNEQVMPMLQSIPIEPRKSDIFTEQLKRKYEKLYDSILPVPFLRDKNYCVNNVFVESALEYQMSQEKSEGKRLGSYNDLFTLSDSDSKRKLIFGEPGMGKSTLALQIAYDWCNKEKLSPMKNVDILILLRLRQLRGFHTIYDCIRLLLLPQDTTLTTQDVEIILKECNSVYVILDGFDECGDQEVNAYMDIENVIKGDMFQNFHVLVCTRPSCLPKEVPPKTSRVQMKGFDEMAREQYIKKAIAINSSESATYIKEKLKENTILSDFCQIPLLFVMYAHLTYKGNVIDNFNSVTSFFRYIISCFYSHYDNKVTTKSSLLSTNFKENYQPISKAAFDGLFGVQRNIVWDKTELQNLIGSDFYDTYTEIGILVEEEVLEVKDQPGTSSAGHIFNKTEVRFYHKLFCEWYAAHYISDLVSSAIEADFVSVLHKVHETNQQYVFRFACGINPKCADKIIRYLTEKREEDRLAILCLLEKTGDIETIREEISVLCEKQISLSTNDPRIVQRSTTQVLEIASKNKVFQSTLLHKLKNSLDTNIYLLPQLMTSILTVFNSRPSSTVIECILLQCNFTQQIAIANISLRSCFRNVNVAKEHIVLTSGITLPKLRTVCELEIFAEEKEFDVEEVNDIMLYCFLCGNVRILRLKYCLLPKYIQVKTATQTSGNQVTCVIWAPNLFRKYTLDNRSGFWKDKNGRQLDETGYLEEVTSFRAKKP